MKKITPFLQLQILFFALLISSISYAQVGIGTTTPSGGSILDVTSTDKGILVPRVDIADLTSIAPVTGGAPVGLLVWNTNVGTGIGYHYWDGNDWIPISGGSGTGIDWALAGNAAAAVDFLGTTNNIDLNIRTNNIERMRVQNNGQITMNFGAALGNAGQQLNVVGTNVDDIAIGGYSAGIGSGVYGQHVSIVGVPGNGNGVYGFADADVNSTGVRGFNFGNGVGI